MSAVGLFPFSFWHFAHLTFPCPHFNATTEITLEQRDLVRIICSKKERQWERNPQLIQACCTHYGTLKLTFHRKEQIISLFDIKSILGVFLISFSVAYYLLPAPLFPTCFNFISKLRSGNNSFLHSSARIKYQSCGKFFENVFTLCIMTCRSHYLGCMIQFF